MKMKIRQMTAVLAALIMMTLLFPAAAFAREHVDLAAKGSITLQYPCAGIEFQLYRVAEPSLVNEFTAVGDFADEKYAYSLNQPDQAGWSSLAVTLANYAERDKLTPLETKVTGQDGRLTFDTDELGLYLVTWKRHTTDGVIYIPKPILLSVPSLNVDDSWNYQVTAIPKYATDTPYTPPGGGGGEPSTLRRRVHKSWDDAGFTDLRPDSIEAQLLCDGDVYDTVTLSANNGWSYEWDDLERGYNWQVVEKDIPAGYQVQIERSGITFLITNKIGDWPIDIVDDDVPLGGLEIPDGEIPLAMLPQTGMLWWPVPILICLGFAMMAAGWMLRRERG